MSAGQEALNLSKGDTNTFEFDDDDDEPKPLPLDDEKAEILIIA